MFNVEAFTKRILSVFILFIASFIFISCSKQTNKELTNEIVMNTGMVIKAHNTNGLITIEADHDLNRLYIWDNTSIKVKMIHRDRRWDGSLGIYNPGRSNKIRTIVEEGQQHFYSEQEAIEWLSWQDNRMHYVYSEDGLVVGWYKTENSLSVQVWQFYILGNRPDKLPGARNDLLKVTLKKGVLPQSSTKRGRFQPSSPQMINGRWYSGKSIDIVKEKQISTDEVERIIKKGRYQQQGNYLYYYDLKNSEALWILLDKQHRVVLLGR